MTDDPHPDGKAPRQDERGLNRRDFVKAGAAAGVGAAVLAGPEAARAQEAPSAAGPGGIQWTHEADVVVIGGGCTGLPAAIRATDLGASVIVVEQNFDLGGKMLHSGAQVSFGGGDALQLRDIAGEADKEGFITVPPVHTPEEMTEDVDFLFRDMTDWSVVDPAAQAPYRYNEREMHRAWADNCAATRQFMIDNYVRFARVSGTHGNAGASRARRATCFLKLGDVTDIRAGTVTREDAGIAGVSSSHFAPRLMADASAVAAPDTVSNGAALARGLEFAAREKGVQIMLNQHMDEIIREEPFSGRVLGIRTSYSPRINPETGERLESYWQNGNLDERGETVYIRARKAIMIAAGGHTNNPQFRSMMYPAWREPAYVSSGWALLGPRGQDASGIIAGMRVGGNLAGLQQNLSYPSTYHIPTTIGTRDSYTDMLPGHPTFVFRGSTGIALGETQFEHLIAVNQVGKRFFNDLELVRGWNHATWPVGPERGTPKSGLDHVQLDWRNCSPDWIRQMYNASAGVHAAVAMNEGSIAPDFHSGPIWAIFDQGAIDRDGWEVREPFVSESNGCFFRADTIEELAAKIEAGNEFQRVPLTYLAETVETWNAAVDAGVDEEFGRGPDAPMHKINQPPFFAAIISPVWHDSFGGLRINGKAQVIDTAGEVIPGLYCGGESSGGGNQHGLGRCLVHGYIAGSNVVNEPAT
jgi:hypothetical protein